METQPKGHLSQRYLKPATSVMFDEDVIQKYIHTDIYILWTIDSNRDLKIDVVDPYHY